MFRLLVTAGLIAAANCYASSGLTSSGLTSSGLTSSGLTSSGLTSSEVTSLTAQACKTALAPTATEQQLERTAVTKCIAEQAGLQAIIDSLGSAESDESLESSASDESTNSVEGTGDPDGHHHNVAALLEANSHLTKATTLRQCIAREKGMLNTDGTYNMVKLKEDILSKVAWLTVEANTKLGVNGCTVVVEFDVPEYMHCIKTYCSTGAAP